jgi:hypothetical protein
MARQNLKAKRGEARSGDDLQLARLRLELFSDPGAPSVRVACAHVARRVDDRR